MFQWVYLTHKSPRGRLSVKLCLLKMTKNSYTPEWFGFLKIPYLVRSFGRNGEVGKLNYSG